ncbi:hypothetical protein SAY86_023878 [Trapa natans]|uniref:Quinolinate phosphoribosyltransferase [decarboxylating] n=1 Tax=Trapa natans TaxID=22666 RepID=A0AAN7RBW9_TRANT|nr:hypothetical protein SAY86_023878 [Trapa natans]
MTVKPPSHPTYDLNRRSSISDLFLPLKFASALVNSQGDVTCMATIPSEMEVEAWEDGVLAEIALAEMVFHEVDRSLKAEWSQADGDYVHRGVQFGKSYSVVVAERVALNFMQRMSGIANFNKCTLAMADAARPACILETRKTAPGLRLVDKWAVLIGGVKNHRIGLFDMVMIKDNHISTAGGVTNAIRSVDMYLQQKKSQDGCRDVSMLQEAVKLINGKFETEASGNVTLETVHKIGQTGVTYISRSFLPLLGQS